jgi:Cys-tRNA(Pro)/Cys-tRNA(Cys) deacylase
VAAITPALNALARAGVNHRVLEYTVGDSEDTYGETVAAALGVDPARLFKTLVVTVDQVPVLALIPVSRHLSLKALARVAGGKRAVMATPAQAERWSGYVVGGISPFGQRTRLPAFVDISAGDHDRVLVSAGQRGLQVELSPSDLLWVLSARTAPLTQGTG